VKVVASRFENWSGEPSRACQCSVKATTYALVGIGLGVSALRATRMEPTIALKGE